MRSVGSWGNDYFEGVRSFVTVWFGEFNQIYILLEK